MVWAVNAHLAPLLEDLASDNPNAKVVKVNVDDNPGLAARYRIESIPNLIVFKGGNVVDQYVGFADKEATQSFCCPTRRLVGSQHHRPYVGTNARQMAFNNGAFHGSAWPGRNQRSLAQYNGSTLGTNRRRLQGVRRQASNCPVRHSGKTGESYNYEDFKNDMSPQSQVSLAEQYEQAGASGQMVVFVRDNNAETLVSYAFDYK